jgi:ankyrin repeat protein
MMKILASQVKDLNVFSPPLLHVAANRELSNIQMIDYLIQLGVNVSGSYREVDDERRRSTGAPVPSYAAAHVLATGERYWNISALESLCKAGADLEMTDGDGNTVLRCALNGLKSGSEGAPGFWRDETLEVLLKHGANINALSPDNGQTPLIAALESTRGRKLVQKLLKCGADINLGSIPALFAAIESEDPEATAAILDSGAAVNAVYHPKQPREYGRGPKVETPLLAAAMKVDGLHFRDKQKSKIDRTTIGTLLLQRGANPLMELQDGETSVLHEIARCHGYIKAILECGADLETRDSQGHTPLLAACSQVDNMYRVTKHESTPRELILAGANIHATDNAGCSPSPAVQSGLVKTVTLLLKKGAAASATNNARLTPLYYALRYSSYQTQLELTKTLLSAGAESLITGPKGESPLHLLAPSLIQARAREYNYESEDYPTECKALYQRFIDSGCDRNARDYLGNTPLFLYVMEIKRYSDYFLVDPPPQEDVRKMLENHDVFAVNGEGDTLLHIVAAREEGYESVPDGVWLFKELMAMGLDPRKENKKGVSALNVAARVARRRF